MTEGLAAFVAVARARSTLGNTDSTSRSEGCPGRLSVSEERGYHSRWAARGAYLDAFATDDPPATFDSAVLRQSLLGCLGGSRGLDNGAGAARLHAQLDVES